MFEKFTSHSAIDDDNYVHLDIQHQTVLTTPNEFQVYYSNNLHNIKKNSFSKYLENTKKKHKDKILKVRFDNVN